MTARDIEIFCTIMRCHTISAAAQQLHVTQPALSKALGHCEDRLGYKLFHRIGGRLKPTAEASVLIAPAMDVHRKIRSLAQFSAEIGGHARGILRIGATSSVACSIVPRAIAALRGRMPGVHVVLQMLAVPELEEGLASKRVDIGVALSPLAAPVRESHVIASVPCVALVRRGHALARRGSVTLGDLQGLPEIGFGPGQDFGRDIEAAFRAAGLERKLSLETSATTPTVALVSAGMGFAIVDAFTRAYLPDDVCACRLDPAIMRPLTVARSPGSGTPELADSFQIILQDIAEEFLSIP